MWPLVVFVVVGSDFFPFGQLLGLVVGDLGHDVTQELFHGVAFAAAGNQRLFDILKFGLRPALARRTLSGLLAGLIRRSRGRLAIHRPRAGIGHGFFGKDAVAAKGTIAPARDAVHRDRRIEVIRDTLPLLFRRRVQQPHQKEERHHGGHEVSVGHFPCPAVVAPATDDFLPLDDDWRRIALRSHSTSPWSDTRDQF